jgi:hypothetical protein
MNKFTTFWAVTGACLALTNAQAADSVVGENFVVTRPTTISEIGISDGGVPLTGDVTVGIFNSATGGLVGSEVTFGPGLTESQIGNSVFENIGDLVLPSGEYSVVAVGDVGQISGGTSGLFQVDSLGLGSTLGLPGGGRFNSGALFDLGGYSSTPSNPGGSTGFDIVDPVPDGGSTVIILGGALAGLGLLRRKLA